MDTNSWRTLLPLINGTSAIVGLGCQIAILVVVAGAVRRHRPDAYTALLAWSIAALVASAVLPLAGVATTVLAVRMGGIESVLLTHAIHAGTGIVVHIALAFLLIRGLVRLAQPPKPAVVETDAPYR